MSKWDSTSLIGQTFARLTVVKLQDKEPGVFRARRYWVCSCSCGNEAVVSTDKLKNGNTKSCGCLREEWLRPQLVGEKFHKLTVIEPAGMKKTSSLWLCQCDCGNTVRVRTCDLKGGSVRSCGCLRPGGKHTLEANESIRNLVFFMYRDNAKTRGREFTLTIEEAEVLFQQNCIYCGATPSRTRTRRNRKGSYTYNGIDRKDNSLGYTIENVVTCCTKCNLTKGSMNYQEFVNWIGTVFNHMNLS